MSLDEVIDLQITAESSSATRAGFGTMLCLAYHLTIPDITKVYTSPSELTDDGFAVTDPAYRMAQTAFSQNPKPQRIVLGKRTHAYTQIVELTPTITTAGYHYTFEVVDPVGVVTAIDYTVLTGATVATICTALAALIDPVASVTAVSATTKITVTAAAGKLFNLRKLPIPSELKIKDVTADPGIVADLTAIEAADATSWYAVTADHSPQTVIEAAAAWIEARRKIAVFNTSDEDVLEALVTSDVCSSLKAASYARTEVLGSYKELLSNSAAAWLGRMLPTDPGSASWAFKTLKGITVDSLGGAAKTAATTKRLNTYTILGGWNVTQWGQDPDGGYTDVVVGTDWLYARIQEAIIAALASRDKIPMTDSGAETIRSLIMSILDLGIQATFLAETPAPVVMVPKIKDVTTADKAARRLPGITFSATLAGAIHTVVIKGALSV
jgi:hypothetical protein